ncbi:MAG: F0F1 ATP synthase subunit A [bacterium]|nr:F0F1 ATP synthase subunit A [bacterium]
MHIELAAETLFHLGPLPVTNTLFTTLLITLLLTFFAWKTTRSLSLVPSGLQNLTEMIFEPINSLVRDLAHDRAKLFFPIVTTFFLLILVSNWFGLLPGVGTIGFFTTDHGEEKFLPLLRAPTSDLNMTLALALLSMVITHVLSIKLLGFGTYLSKFFSINPIFLFVGLIELVSEFTKIVSLSFRLFGNIFAGETVLTSISALGAFIFPLPFLALEIIVGFVQALVFMMLTLVFLSLLTEKQHAH